MHLRLVPRDTSADGQERPTGLEPAEGGCLPASAMDVVECAVLALLSRDFVTRDEVILAIEYAINEVEHDRPFRERARLRAMMARVNEAPMRW